MAKTDLKVTIDADAAKLQREIDRSTRSMERLERQIDRDTAAAQRFERDALARQGEALEKLGAGMMKFGAVAAAGFGLATKAAVDWETAWTGVLKTVDGSDAELAALEGELRELATTLPATHTEIAGVAEAAGQLGVATPDVAEFTRTMILLGETTNLSAADAATALARMSNIMGTATSDVDRLGSTIVELGNNFATTEAEITDMALRIAGAGAQIGLTEADVLSLSAALSSVGIPAEAGGTAISRVMADIASSVASGEEAVSGFAEVAGVSSAEFIQSFERDPAAAIQTFVAGLGRIEASGGDTFAALEQLDFGSIRVRDTLLRLSGAGDLLNDTLETGAGAWASNTALVEEAEQRFDTAEAKIRIAWNALVDMGIDIGNVLLPAVSGLAEGLADLAGWFGELPGPLQTVVTLVGGLATVAALSGGAFLMLAPRLAAARAELSLMGPMAQRGAAGLTALGRAAGIVGALFAVAGAVHAIVSATDEAAPGIGETTSALLDLADGVETDLLASLFASHTEIVRQRQALQDAKNSWTEYKDSFAGTDLDDIVAGNQEFADQIEHVDTALAQLVAGGNADKADEIVQALAAGFGLQEGEIEQLLSALPRYTDELDSVENEQRLATEETEAMSGALTQLAADYGLTGDDAAKAAQEMLDSWSDAAGEFVSFTDAYDTALAAKEESEREAAQATADATSDQSDSWEDFIGDVTLSVDEYLAELERQVKAQQEWENNLLTIAGRVPNEMLDHFARLGPEGAEEVALLAQMTDEELAQAAEAWMASTGEGVDAIMMRLAEAGPVIEAIAEQHGEDVAEGIRVGMIANRTGVFEEAKAQGVAIDEGVGTDETRDIPINVLPPTGTARAERDINNVARDRSVRISTSVNPTTGALGSPGIHSGGTVSGSFVARFHQEDT